MLLAAVPLIVVAATLQPVAAAVDAATEIAPVRNTTEYSGIVKLETIVLTMDEPVFTDGPFVENMKWVGRDFPDTKHDPVENDVCERDGQVPCFEYTVEVPEGGWRLRVAIDALSASNDPSEVFWLELYDPKQKWNGESFSFETGEVMVWPSDPEADAPAGDVPSGDWTVRVIPRDVNAASFRLRTVVESQAGATARLPKKDKILPNLRAEPPYDLTFQASPILDKPAEGRELPVGCQADEAVEDGVTRCLRFAFGYQNNGDGPYEVQLTPRADDPLVADVVQRIYRQDDTPWYHGDNVTKLDAAGSPYFFDRPAGTASFHPMPGHTHWHYDNIYTAVLYAVDQGTGDLEQLNSAAKFGACAHDWALVEFDRVFQDKRGHHDSGSRCDFINPASNAPTNEELAVALSVGWGDVYPVGTPDNYVAFDDHAEGEYVLRVKSDADDLLRETNEKDNHAYTYFEVTNCQPTACDVRILERGRGTGPWDKKKVILHGLGE